MKTKHRIVKWQPVRDKEDCCNDPYHKWLEEQAFVDEPALANPDVLPSKESPSFGEDFIERFIDNDGKISVLSTMEQKVFDLFVKQGVKLSNINKHLNISKSSVRIYFKRMQHKLKVLFDSL